MDLISLKKYKSKLKQNLRAVVSKDRFRAVGDTRDYRPELNSLAALILDTEAKIINFSWKEQENVIKSSLAEYENYCVKRYGGDLALFNGENWLHTLFTFDDENNNLGMMGMTPHNIACYLGNSFSMDEKFNADIEGFSINFDLWTMKWNVNTCSNLDVFNKIFKNEEHAAFACDLLNESKDVKRWVLMLTDKSIMNAKKHNKEWWNWSREVEKNKKLSDINNTRLLMIKEIIRNANYEVAKKWRSSNAAPEFKIDKEGNNGN